MDMITRLELEEALKVKTKVDERVRDVALEVARIEGEIDDKPGRSWRMSS